MVDQDQDSQEKQVVEVKASKQNEKLRRDRELDDLRFLLSTQQGCRFISLWVNLGGFYRLSHAASGSVTSFNEGGRNVALNILNDVIAALKLPPGDIQSALTHLKKGSG